MNLITTIRKKREPRELRCKWEKKMNYNLKIKYSMQQKKFYDKNLGSIKDLKVSKALNGINSKICQTNMTESSSSKTTTKLIRRPSRTTSQKDLPIQVFTWKLQLKILARNLLIIILVCYFHFYWSINVKWLLSMEKCKKIHTIKVKTL